MAKRKKKEPVFELTPLPPNAYEKPVTWNTPDGERPPELHCKVQGCGDYTFQTLCEEHFREWVGRIQGELNGKLVERLRSGAA